MTEEQWGVFFAEDDGRTYLVAVEQSKDEAIETAWALDEEKRFEHMFEGDLPNLHRVEPISDELAADADEQLAQGEAVLVWEP